jgi:hypothetical protein
MRFPFGGARPMDDQAVRWQERMRLISGQAAIFSQRAAQSTFRRLWDAEVSVYSQWGEDGILDYLCEHLDIPKPNIVEFGIGDFTECNSRFLAEYRNARVYGVDALPDLQERIQPLDVYWKTTIVALESWVTPDNAPAILEDAERQFGSIDILSIDLDGNDYWVLDALDLEGIKILVTEYNPLFGPILPVSILRDDTFDRTNAHYSWLYFGASLAAMVEAARARGFTFVGTNRAGNNAFFVAGDASSIPLEMPTADLSQFLDWRVREARSPDGVLTFEALSQAQHKVAHLPLVRTDNGQLLTVGEASSEHGPRRAEQA